MRKNGSMQGYTDRIQLWILPFTGQNSQIARRHFPIDGRVFTTTAIVHL